MHPAIPIQARRTRVRSIDHPCSVRFLISYLLNPCGLGVPQGDRSSPVGPLAHRPPCSEDDFRWRIPGSAPATFAPPAAFERLAHPVEPRQGRGDAVDLPHHEHGRYDGDGSLRWAITQSDKTTGPNVIDFAISGTGVHTIDLGSALPAITEPVTIDGTTQSGYISSPVLRR